MLKSVDLDIFSDTLLSLINKDSNIIIPLAIIFSAILFIVLFLITIFSSRIYKTYNETRIKRLKGYISEFITEYIYNEEEEGSWKIGNMVGQFRKQHLKSELSRQLMINEIINFHKKFSGEISEKLLLLYFQLGLNSDSAGKLRKWKWEVKAKGIREISDLKITVELVNVQYFINAKNDILRNEAQIALVRLSEKNHLNFLHFLNKPLSEWQQIQLFNALQALDKKDIPDFSQWLQTKNDSVVLFSLKMIARFNQSFVTDKIISLLQHQNAGIRILSIHTIAELESFEALPALLNVFNTEDRLVKIAIIKAIGKLGDDSHLKQLESLLVSPDFEAQLETAKAMKKLSGKGRLRLEELKTDERFSKVILHVMDDLI